MYYIVGLMILSISVGYQYDMLLGSQIFGGGIMLLGLLIEVSILFRRNHELNRIISEFQRVNSRKDDE